MEIADNGLDIICKNGYYAAMDILQVLYTIIIAPLEMIIEAVFCFYRTKIDVAGAAGAIAAVSLAIGFLTLPIYNIADAIQKKERDVQAKLSHWVCHIKKHFTGDERFMMLSYYYKQNGYHPLYALRSSLSIMIEVPFFIAAYHFLSHCPALQGVSCGVLQDLGKPDHLITFSAGGGHSLTFNLLPILMTAINAASSAVYLKGFAIREKAQTYCLAIIFLILLYNSPSGLVLYWTLNNLFSLAKNAVQRWMKEPWRAAHGCVSLAVIAGVSWKLFIRTSHQRSTLKWTVLFALSLVFLAMPYAIKAWRKKHPQKARPPFGADGVSLFLFLASALGLALLCGLVLPSSVIATSPREFALSNKTAPLHYLKETLCVFAGFFLLWPAVIYKMLGASHTSGEKIKCAMPYFFAFAFIMALLNVYVFGFAYSNMDSFLQFDNSDCLTEYSKFYVFAPVAAFCFVIFLLILFKRYKALKYLPWLITGGCIAECALGALNVSVISSSYNKYIASKNEAADAPSIEPIYHLSKTGKNVVVLFLDRAVSSFFPYIVQQFPKLATEFDGFVYYPNTVSFSNFTAKGSPAMMGGYEYTPEAMNARENELLIDKHNEAMLTAPRLFSEAGYEVTVTDPPFSNYEWSGDSAPFASYPHIKCDFVIWNYKERYALELGMNGELGKSGSDMMQGRLDGYCLMLCAPPIARNIIYDRGSYLRDKELPWDEKSGISQFSQMYYLGDLTDCTASGNTYTFICNELPHAVVLLKPPEYVPHPDLDEIDADCGYYDWKEEHNKSQTSFNAATYSTNAAAMLQTARWLDKLRKMGVYDSTRIIIVADHGTCITHTVFDGMKDEIELGFYNPLLLVKDFNSHGKVKTDSVFMTNADTILLSKQGLSVSDINPFTGKSISAQVDKSEVRIYPAFSNKEFSEVIISPPFKKKKRWVLGQECHPLAVHDNIFDEKNWRRLDTDTEKK